MLSERDQLLPDSFQILKIDSSLRFSIKFSWIHLVYMNEFLINEIKYLWYGKELVKERRGSRILVCTNLARSIPIHPTYLFHIAKENKTHYLDALANTW